MIPYLVMEASLSMDVINQIPKHFLFTLATSFKAETAIFPLNFFQLTNGLDFSDIVQKISKTRVLHYI